VAILALGISARPSTTVWSPYQKLDVVPVQAGWTKAYTVRVNNIGYMNLLDLSRRGVRALPIHVNPAEQAAGPLKSSRARRRWKLHAPTLIHTEKPLPCVTLI